MRNSILAILGCLVPGILFAEDAAPDMHILTVTAQPGPVLPVLAQDQAARMLPTDWDSTHQAIDGMRQAIDVMAFAPRLDPVSVTVTTMATRWETAIGNLAERWSDQTRVAVMTLTGDVAESIETFPASGFDFEDGPLFEGPVFHGEWRSPVTGFFGP